jgi:hypothetical protein
LITLLSLEAEEAEQILEEVAVRVALDQQLVQQVVAEH